MQNFSEHQILWSLCSVVFHAFALRLPIQTPLSVVPKLPVSLRSHEKCPNFRKTSTPLRFLESCMQWFPVHYSSTLQQLDNTAFNWRRSTAATLLCSHSSGSSGRVGGGKKHEIYATAFGSHFFITYFYSAEGHYSLAPSGSTTASGSDTTRAKPPHTLDLSLSSVTKVHLKTRSYRCCCTSLRLCSNK